MNSYDRTIRQLCPSSCVVWAREVKSTYKDIFISCSLMLCYNSEKCNILNVVPEHILCSAVKTGTREAKANLDTPVLKSASVVQVLLKCTQFLKTLRTEVNVMLGKNKMVPVLLQQNTLNIHDIQMSFIKKESLIK